jgi:hypothetical protein
MWYTVFMGLLPMGTLVTHTTNAGKVVGMIIGTWSFGSDNEFIDRIGNNPTRAHGDLGYIILISGLGRTKRVFFGDTKIGKLDFVMANSTASVGV